MNVRQRRGKIVDLVHGVGRVDGSDLSTRFGVNAETIRRDLAALQESGQLQRVHGGAVARSELAVEGLMSNRISEHREEKVAIARAAALDVPAFGAIFIEAGSTTAHLVDLLLDRGDLLIITNALQTALQLAESCRSTVMTIGGRVRAESYAEVDAWALERLASLNVDVAFIGTNALDPVWGLSTPDPAEAAVKAAIIGSAQRSVLMVDQSKFGMRAAFRYAGIEDVDLVVTNRADETATAVEELRLVGTAVRVAEDCDPQATSAQVAVTHTSEHSPT